MLFDVNFWIIFTDGMKYLQHLLQKINSDLIRIMTSRKLNCILIRGLVLTAVISENILSTEALLTGIVNRVRAYSKSSLNGCWRTPIQICSEPSEIPFFLNFDSSFQSTYIIFPYCSSILEVYSARYINVNSENREIWLKIIAALALLGYYTLV